MKYRKLGQSDLRVSELCLGTMMFGDQTDQKSSADIVAHALEHGVNFLDTADVYTKGASETIVGEVLGKQRHQWVVATKLGNKMSDRPNEGGYSRNWMMRAVEGSLARLRTDYIDVYYMHRDIAGLNLEEPVRAMGDMIRAGKIRAFGVSNFRGWRIAEMAHLCDQLGVPRPVVCQPYYNLLNRGPEVEVLPSCTHYGVGVVPYSPIARGVLTGKYQPGKEPPKDTRAGRKDKRILETELRDESLQIAQKLLVRAEQKGVTLSQFAVAWVLANRVINAVIAGPRTLEQWKDYFGALDCVIDAADEQLVDSLVTPGHPSTPGYNDPSYPFHGRVLAA